MPIRSRVVSLLLCLPWIGGCSATFPGATSPSTQESVRLLYSPYGTDWPADLVRFIDLTAYSVDSDGGWIDRRGAVRCTSSNIAVAGVSASSCLVFGASGGTAFVNAVYSAQAASTEVAFVNRVYPALRITFQPAQLTLPLRGTMRAIIFNSVNGPGRDVTNAATWSSSDTRVATMTGNVFTGVTPGNVEISATVDGETVRYRVGVPPRSF